MRPRPAASLSNAIQKKRASGPQLLIVDRVTDQDERVRPTRELLAEHDAERKDEAGGEHLVPLAPQVVELLRVLTP